MQIIRPVEHRIGELVAVNGFCEITLLKMTVSH